VVRGFVESIVNSPCDWCPFMQELSNELADLLEPGETVLWSGRPHVTTYAKRGMWSSAIQGIFFAVVLLVIEMQAVADGVWLWHFICFPFWVAVFYLLAGRLWFLAREAKKTSYFVTNKGIWIMHEWVTGGRTYIPMKSMQTLQYSQNVSGIGSIRFAAPSHIDTLVLPGYPWFWPHRHTPALLCVENVKEVLGVIKRAKQEACA
jgi:hypothetical protein